MMPILHSSGVITPGQFGPTRWTSAVADDVVDADHVDDGHAFGDRDDDFAAGVDRFEDRIGGEGGRHEDHRGVGAFLLDGFEDGVEDRHAERRLAALAGRDAGDELGAVLDAVLGMKLARPCR